MLKSFPMMFIGICLLVCESAQNSNSKKVVLSKDYGVKLCGREFIRAVIFTCGGSRWKRAGNLDFLLNSESDSTELGFITAVSQQAGMLNRPDASVNQMRMSEQPAHAFPLPFLSIFPLHSLKSLDIWKQTHAESNKEQPGANGSNLQGVVPLSAGPDQDTNMPWLHYERKKRNFSHGLAGICCNQGCTKNDIGRLC